ncbi:hypothetical protein BGZ63DRAFT_368271 [Mariannaea sp. PMI_226]|nr:hypothetical protein BGZ63DRAFT_368271 [Mariannaea sp. PMI_226]
MGDGREELHHGVENVISHRIRNSTQVKLKIRRTGCSRLTCVDEHILQQDCPKKLYNYWESIGGRRKATGIHLFHIFQIRRWRVKDNELLFLVQWVGYPPGDSTWERACRVKILAKEMHSAYLKTHWGARRAWDRRRGT